MNYGFRGSHDKRHEDDEMRILNTLFLIVTAGLCVLANSASAQYSQQRGTVVGGLTGAAAGAIIGDNSDEAGVGAAIGGVVGALAGSILGNAQDRQVYEYEASRQRNAYQIEAARQQQAAYHQTRAMAVQDVVGMAQSDVADSIILGEIQNRGIQRPLEIADIVFLSQQGVSEAVIRCMQHAAVGGPAPIQASRCVAAPVIVTRPAPVIVARPAPTVIIHGYHGHSRHYGYGPHYHAHRPSVRRPIYYR